jgi:hypothetical protein
MNDHADAPTAPAVYELDGARITTLESFVDEVSRVLVPGAEWGRNLDAFNDVLRGGFGTPEGGFVLVWRDHHLSRERLGYAETVRQLEQTLARCHPTNRAHVERALDAARRGSGPTVFDRLVRLISAHGPGGDEASDGVRLELR